MKVDVYKSELDDYIEMDLLGKYKYIGETFYNGFDLTKGYIYDRVGSEDEFRIVDDTGEDHLYLADNFEKAAEQYIPCPNCDGHLVNILYGMPNYEAFEQAKKKELYLGGCEILIDCEEPAYHCYKCNRSYYRNLVDYVETNNNWLKIDK